MTVEKLIESQKEIIKKRKKISRNFIIFWVVLFLVTLVYFVFRNNGLNMFPFGQFYFIVIIETIFIICFYTSSKNINLKSDILLFKYNFKKVFVLESLKEIFNNLNYNPGVGVSEDVIDKTKLIMLYDRFSSNDYISGTYKSVKFEQSDVHVEELEEYEDSDGKIHQKWLTTFLGKWMCFDFNKEFKTDVIIFNSKDFNWWGSYAGIRMEDEEFNSMFSVYAKSEHDAFYILTPHFMERMKNINKYLSDDTIFGFINNKLYIVMNNDTDSFEYDVFKPIDEKKVKDDILKEIRIITSFIDELNLDNNLFK